MLTNAVTFQLCNLRDKNDLARTLNLPFVCIDRHSRRQIIICKFLLGHKQPSEV